MEQNVGWEPVKCPKDEGDMILIPKMDKAWKCVVCGLEVWDGDVPTQEEYSGIVHDKMLIQSPTSQKPYISRSFVGGVHGGGGSSGRRHKEKPKPDLQSKYGAIEATVEKKK